MLVRQVAMQPVWPDQFETSKAFQLYFNPIGKP